MVRTPPLIIQLFLVRSLHREISSRTFPRKISPHRLPQLHRNWNTPELSERHASENLNFRESVERYRALFSQRSRRTSTSDHEQRDEEKETEGGQLTPSQGQSECGRLASTIDAVRAAACGIVKRFVNQCAPDQVKTLNM